MTRIIQNISRRAVLRAGAGTGVFMLATTLAACGGPEETFVADAPAADPVLRPLNLFVSIDEAGTVQVMCHRAEMGQGARTGLARVIADELDADWSRVTVLQAEGETKYGDQNTDGSTTIRRDFMRLRRIGASARAMLERAAAEQWGVPVEECKAEFHEVAHAPSGRRTGYGELAAAAAAFDPP
ncbi:MAG: molybdopterin cofactor-binding domain-containing protein, partial [Pseudomonadota bacterium]